MCILTFAGRSSHRSVVSSMVLQVYCDATSLSPEYEHIFVQPAMTCIGSYSLNRSIASLEMGRMPQTGFFDEASTLASKIYEQGSSPSLKLSSQASRPTSSKDKDLSTIHIYPTRSIRQCSSTRPSLSSLPLLVSKQHHWRLAPTKEASSATTTAASGTTDGTETVNQRSIREKQSVFS